jgi:hypothetical protein
MGVYPVGEYGYILKLWKEDNMDRRVYYPFAFEDETSKVFHDMTIYEEKLFPAGKKITIRNGNIWRAILDFARCECDYKSKFLVKVGNMEPSPNLEDVQFNTAINPDVKVTIMPVKE